MADKYCLGSVTFGSPDVLLDTPFKSGSITLTNSIFNYNFIMFVYDYGTTNNQVQTQTYYIGKNKNNIRKDSVYFAIVWGNSNTSSFQTMYTNDKGTVLTVNNRAGKTRLMRIYGFL